jgi:hypothetical protein
MMRGVWAHIAMFALLAMLVSGAAVAMLLRPIETDPIESKASPLQLPLPPMMSSLRENESSSLAKILARPLFYKSRRPFETPAAEIQIAPQPAEPPVQLTAAETLMLKGVFLGPKLSKAFIASPANPSGIWVALGAEIEGWKIEAITSADVRVVQQQHSAILTLYRQEAVR